MWRLDRWPFRAGRGARGRRQPGRGGQVRGNLHRCRGLTVVGAEERSDRGLPARRESREDALGDRRVRRLGYEGDDLGNRVRRQGVDRVERHDAAPSAERSRPPMPPPNRSVRHITFCMPVPDAPTMPMMRNTESKYASGTTETCFMPRRSRYIQPTTLTT